MTVGRRQRTQRATIRRVKVKAVKSVVMMPTAWVTANPRTGPEPMQKSTAAAISVVRFASMIVAERALEAGVDRRDGRTPGAVFLAHALIDEHVRVHRHAHGKHDAGDAGQSQRRAENADTMPNIRTRSLAISAMLAKSPKKP